MFQRFDALASCFSSPPCQLVLPLALLALEHVAGFGDPFVVGGSKVGDLWRIDVGAAPGGGVERFYAVWLTADGAVTTAASAWREVGLDGP